MPCTTGTSSAVAGRVSIPPSPPRPSVSISPGSVRPMDRPSSKERDMKYMLLIHQGTTPTPQTPEWENLSDDEQGAVYADYKAVRDTPGVTSGLGLQPPETATTVRV